MDRAARMNLIKEIESLRDSKLLVYIVPDRENLTTRIATDIFPILHDHLLQTCGQERLQKIDLLIYSTGGVTMAGYALVNLFREFCEQFNVIIPFKALSTATLIALGADEVVMTRMGQLSPIDPSVVHTLGPVVELPGQEEKQLVPLNVEDVNAFLDLARNEFKLETEEAISKVFDILTGRVNAIALGAVHRAREQIAFLATRLMEYHDDDNEHVKNVVDILTRERFSHDYVISRREASEILNLKIIEPDKELTNCIMSLFGAYSEITMMGKPYNPEMVLGTQESKTEDFNLAVIESAQLTHIYRQKKEIRRIKISQGKGKAPGIGYQERLIERGWMCDDAI